MTSTLRERRRQMLRDEIMSAAQELMAEKGYSAMSMDELALRVGISKPTLYGHFGAKDEVAIEVAVQRMEVMIEQIERAAKNLTPLQRLLFVLRESIQLQLSHKAIPLQSWSPELFQVICTSERARAQIQRIHNEIRSLVEKGVALGEIDPLLDIDTVTLMFYSSANALRILKLGIVATPDANAAAETLTTMFERSVRVV